MHAIKAIAFKKTIQLAVTKEWWIVSIVILGIYHVDIAATATKSIESTCSDIPHSLLKQNQYI